ncbi:MAG TPA: DUF2341 domain-containing protein [Polyangia bacterium]
MSKAQTGPARSPSAAFCLGLASFSLLLGTGACRSAGDSGPPVTVDRTGGTTGSGGRTGSGGARAGSGGTNNTGGSTGNGGATSTGGSMSPPGTGGSTGDAGRPDAADASSAPDATRDTSPDSSTPPTPAGPTDLTKYRYTKVLRFNTTATGANITANVEKYPLAILLNATNFDFMQAKANGEDIRFAKADGTILPHAIELWDRAAATAAVWVKVDHILGNSNTQTIQMFWGFEGAVDASDSKAVFPQADGFVGVYHLGEEGNTTAGGYKDASSHEAHATGLNLMPDARVDGRIGKATNLANPAGGMPASRWIRMDTPDKLTPFNTLPVGQPISISIWTKATSYPNSYVTIMSKGDTSWTLQRFSTTNQYEPCVQARSGTMDYHLCTPSTARTAANTWVHFGVVFQEPRFLFYVNGVLDSMTSAGPWNKGEHAFGIGNQTQFNARRFWDGIMDEARVMRAARSVSWFKLDYESQREGQKLLTFGPTQTRS